MSLSHSDLLSLKFLADFFLRKASRLASEKIPTIGSVSTKRCQCNNYRCCGFFSVRKPIGLVNLVVSYHPKKWTLRYTYRDFVLRLPCAVDRMFKFNFIITPRRQRKRGVVRKAWYSPTARPEIWTTSRSWALCLNHLAPPDPCGPVGKVLWRQQETLHNLKH